MGSADAWTHCPIAHSCDAPRGERHASRDRRQLRHFGTPPEASRHVIRSNQEDHMRTSRAQLVSRSLATALLGTLTVFAAPSPVRANVVTDWDERAVTIVTPLGTYAAQRGIGMVHI